MTKKLFGMKIKEDKNLKNGDFELRNSVQRIDPIIIDSAIVKLTRVRADIVKHICWKRVYNSERVIKALLKVGINPRNCFFDQNDNLIIPVSEIQKNNKFKREYKGDWKYSKKTIWERIKMFFMREKI